MLRSQRQFKKIDVVQNALRSQPTISIPTLVVVGKSDIATRPFTSDRMMKAAPHTEQVILSSGWHIALMERNQQFSKVVESFGLSCLWLK